MTYIQPLATALAQSVGTTHEMSAEKTRHARPQPIITRASDPQDKFEHQVESSEEDAPIHEEARQRRQSRQRRQRHPEDEPAEEGAEPAHIDLKA